MSTFHVIPNLLPFSLLFLHLRSTVFVDRDNYEPEGPTCGIDHACGPQRPRRSLQVIPVACVTLRLARSAHAACGPPCPRHAMRALSEPGRLQRRRLLGRTSTSPLLTSKSHFIHLHFSHSLPPHHAPWFSSTATIPCLTPTCGTDPCVQPAVLTQRAARSAHAVPIQVLSERGRLRRRRYLASLLSTTHNPSGMTRRRTSPQCTSPPHLTIRATAPSKSINSRSLRLQHAPLPYFPQLTSTFANDRTW